MDYFYREHNGARFDNYRTSETFDGVAAIGRTKAIIHGKMKITLMTNSYKYGSQVQFSLSCDKLDKFNVVERHESAYNTIELNISLDEGKDIIKAAYEELVKRGAYNEA